MGEKRRELPWEELEKLREHPESLWINSDRTNNGAFNCISMNSRPVALESSSVLIKPNNFAVEVVLNDLGSKIKERLLRNFRLQPVHYSLRITDPFITKRCESKEDRKSAFGDVFLCISLTELYDKDHRCHKLIAAVIANPPI